ncbi:MAG: aminotransferase [Alphaproteobacteria bacterium]|nr:MAG: aminotransferase [Alphaproteobacteria bacterium]
MKTSSNVLAGFGTTIFEVMSKLAIEHKAINLGQGFPDEDGPADILAAAARATEEGPNQYPPMMGVPELRQAVAAHDGRFYGLSVNWQTDTLVTSGATEALAASLLGLINPGDEVVLFEPLYDCYLPMVKLAGGIPKFVRLDPPNWEIDPAKLRAAFSDKTKLVLMNSPMNPTGKVFSVDELQLLADLVIEHDAYAVCDEVYEHIIFGDKRHVSLLTFPGMGDRTVRIASAGKTFSLTGWKVGYLTAAGELIARIAKAHQFLTFTTPPNLQKGVAYGLAKEDDFYDGLKNSMQSKRDRFRNGLERIGFATAECDGTYFLNADISSIGFTGTDEEFCRLITTEAGVAAVPVSAFYQSEGARQNFARFCFAKRAEVLDAAIEKLEDFFGKRG